MYCIYFLRSVGSERAIMHYLNISARPVVGLRLIHKYQTRPAKGLVGPDRLYRHGLAPLALWLAPLAHYFGPIGSSRDMADAPVAAAAVVGGGWHIFAVVGLSAL